MSKKTVEQYFRINKKTSKGSEIFIYGIRFNSKGVIHYFNDHRHAVNFTRYLFSMTKPHPQNILTSRNMVCEYQDGKLVNSHNLNDPNGSLKGFLNRILPRSGADQQYCDDGAYIFFAILTPEKRLISNIVSPDGDAAAIDVGFIQSIGGNQDDIRKIEDMVLRAESLVDFEGEKTPSEISLRADLIVQRLVSERMGFDPVLTVSHRDQLDHNQCYHIHRLIRMVSPERLEV